MRTLGLVLLAAAAATADVAAPSRSVAPESLRLERALAGGDRFVFPAAVSPDGRLVAAGRRDGRIARWEGGTGNPLPALEGHAGYVRAVAFSPSGLLASAGADGALRVWYDGERTLTVRNAHASPVNGLAFADGGRLLLSGAEDGARLSRIRPGEVLVHTLGPRGAVLAVAAADNVAATLDAEGAIRLWNVSTRAPLKTVPGRPLSTCIAITAAGRRLAAGSLDGKVCVWADWGDAPVRTLEAGPGPVHAVAFSPDGRILAAAGADGMRYWDAAQLRATHAERAAATGIAFTGNGALAVVTLADNRVNLWGPRGGGVPAEASERAPGFLGVGHSTREGALVENIVAGSEAEAIGLAANDVIIRVDATEVTQSDDFLNIMRRTHEGDELTLRIRREGRVKVVRAKLGRWQ